MITLLIVVALLCLLFGGYGAQRGDWGYYGWSPLAVILLIALLLWAMGVL